jgi:hypothetical protein
LPASIDARAALRAVSRETVTGRISAKNGFSWPYGFDIEFYGGQVTVNASIRLIAAGGVTQPDLDRVKPIWKKRIESAWSRRFALTTANGTAYPIVVSVTFDGPRWHHAVIVRPGGGRSDALHWNLMNSSDVVAHEFGHMIGAFDEYQRGALAPQSVIDSTSIMTSNPLRGMTYPRHYKRICDWFVSRTDAIDVRIVPVAENADRR